MGIGWQPAFSVGCRDLELMLSDRGDEAVFPQGVDAAAQGKRAHHCSGQEWPPIRRQPRT